MNVFSESGITSRIRGRYINQNGTIFVEESDLQLIGSYLSGSDAAFERLYNRYRQPLYGYLRSMVRGSVCRPGWLVEMDGIAVNSRGNPDFKVFA